jgi:glutamate N-acetyltransferase/amino-acid N-acetyltransferase
MSQLQIVPGGVCAPRGFKAAGVAAGIKPSGNPDVTVVASDCPASAAAVFTTNRVFAAPVQVSREHIADGRAQAIAVNAGCANACTGEGGLADARRMAALAAELLGLAPDDILVASTGVIGRKLPMDRLEAGLREAVQSLSPEAGDAAAEAIMTTDTRPKSISVEIETPEGRLRVGGMCKGSGMIAPNMATMLAFVTTDAAASPEYLQTLLGDVTSRTFNCVTVDGDCSTNDSLFLLANGASGVHAEPGTPTGEALHQAIEHVCTHLARELARDGEGATKLVAVRVTNAETPLDARQVALSIANSPLVKTALFGNDPNWGRILCAAGYSGVAFDPSKAALELSGIPLLKNGEPLSFDIPAASAAMKVPELEMVLDLGAGNAEATVWTCDFSYDYVRINAEYTT